MRKTLWIIPVARHHASASLHPPRSAEIFSITLQRYVTFVTLRHPHPAMLSTLPQTTPEEGPKNVDDKSYAAKEAGGELEVYEYDPVS